jgi:4-hydroxy-tetrahydrodipicolinate reductase
MSVSSSIRVAVSGAAGRMGREVVRAVAEAEDLQLVAAVDRVEVGRDAGELAGLEGLMPPVKIESDLAAALNAWKPHVLVDFTIPASAMGNLRAALEAGVSPVVGTTGLTPSDVEQARQWAETAGVGALISSNFAIGAVLMMQFAAQAAKYLPDVEIIELHHENKLDAPSGTALMTAQKIAAARETAPKSAPSGAVEKLPGARGAVTEGIRIHSVRLPGYVAHQEVIFGGLGQTLTLRHDSTDRRSFMPGVLLAIRRVRELKGLVVGLENLM